MSPATFLRERRARREAIAAACERWRILETMVLAALPTHREPGVKLHEVTVTAGIGPAVMGIILGDLKQAGLIDVVLREGATDSRDRTNWHLYYLTPAGRLEYRDRTRP